MKSNILKVILVDPDVSLHQEYKDYFETYFDYSLEGIYVSVEAALSDCAQIKPDIVFSEVELPGVSGVEGIRLFRDIDPKIRIIMMSAHSEFKSIRESFSKGANGYLAKPVTRQRLYRALNSIRYKGAAMSVEIAKKVISMFQRKSYDNFSERENEIIDYLSQGATYKTIAEKLFVSTSTVNFHIQNIYLKLNVNSKSEALRKIREMDTPIAV